MIPEIAIYEKAIVEAKKCLEAKQPDKARGVLEGGQDDVDRVRQMRQIAQEEIEKTFGDC